MGQSPKSIRSLEVLLNSVKVGMAAGDESTSGEKPKARFSLAGGQMKPSVMKNTGKGGSPALPMGDEQGGYIAKFPSTAFPGVSENEHANPALAAAISLDVPGRELVDMLDFEGIPEAFDTLPDGKVLLVKRFGRGPGGGCTHIEDFVQVCGIYPSRKCEAAAFHDTADVLGAAV